MNVDRDRLRADIETNAEFGGIDADAGLLFAPSRNGISHSPREWTDWEDCARATRVMAGALASLAGAVIPEPT